MIRCSKCNIDKPVDQYATYFHSTQQKIRTRKICNPCFKEQKKQYRESIKMKEIVQPVTPELEIEPIIDYSSNPDYLKCIVCEEWKEIKEDYYLAKGGRPIYKRCKECQKEMDRQRSSNKLKDNGGSLMIGQKPGVFFDEYQRQNTFELMTLFGYLYDKETGIWYKPGVKEIVNGKPVFLKVKKRLHGTPKKINKEMIYKIIELKQNNYTYASIARKLKISETSVQRYLNIYGY